MATAKRKGTDGWPPALVPQEAPPKGTHPARDRIFSQQDTVRLLLADGSEEIEHADGSVEIVAAKPPGYKPAG